MFPSGSMHSVRLKVTDGSLVGRILNETSMSSKGGMRAEAVIAWLAKRK